jgi:hypothetical protein
MKTNLKYNLNTHNIMEELYKDLSNRLAYLKTLGETIENLSRMSEISLVIIKVQDLMIRELGE